jgi:hypothetical protein
VPPSLTTTPSASATVIEPPTDVPPSNKFNSAAVASIAASLVKSACTNPETPSNKFNSAAVEVTAVLPNVSPPSGTTILLPD